MQFQKNYFIYVAILLITDEVHHESQKAWWSVWIFNVNLQPG